MLRGADRDGADLQLTRVRFRVQQQITQRREARAIRNEYPEIEEAERGDRRQVPDGVVRFLNSPTLMALLLLINKRVYPSGKAVASAGASRFCALLRMRT